MERRDVGFRYVRGACLVNCPAVSSLTDVPGKKKIIADVWFVDIKPLLWLGVKIHIS